MGQLTGLSQKAYPTIFFNNEIKFRFQKQDKMVTNLCRKFRSIVLWIQT